MWQCPKCNRVFEKEKQPHSCKSVPLQMHFKNKKVARRIFDCLVDMIQKKVGECRVISIPCCIHLFGHYDFLALLPKKDRLEIRFALKRKIKSIRLKQSVSISLNFVKNCIDLGSVDEIDEELIGWIKEAYYLKGEKKL